MTSQCEAAWQEWFGDGQPVSDADRGDVDLMDAIWIRWGLDNGLIALGPTEEAKGNVNWTAVGMLVALLLMAAESWTGVSVIGGVGLLLGGITVLTSRDEDWRRG